MTTNTHKVDDIVKIAPGFCNPKEKHVRMVVLAVEGTRVHVQIIGSGKKLTLGRQVVIPAGMQA